MEETVIILKPDCMEKRIAGEVISRFERAGFQIVAAELMRLDGPTLREHYAHIADKPFFPDIEAFMSSRPVMLMLLAGDNVIARGARAPRPHELEGSRPRHHPWRPRRRYDAQCRACLRRSRERRRREETLLP